MHLAETQTTQNHKPALADYSLSQLRELKARWVKEAEELGYPDICRQVARWLGGPFQVPGYGLMQAYKWQEGNIVITLYEGYGRYLPQLKTYSFKSVVQVTVRGHQVVNHAVSNDPELQADNLFIPGKWFNQVVAFKTSSADKAKDAGKAGHDQERQALLAQLLIGVEV